MQNRINNTSDSSTPSLVTQLKMNAAESVDIARETCKKLESQDDVLRATEDWFELKKLEK